jgi:hypothetical protein
MPATTLKFSEFGHIFDEIDPTSSKFIEDIEKGAAAHVKKKTGLIVFALDVQQTVVDKATANSVFKFTPKPDMDATVLKRHLRTH